jgi:hypothetical protein
MREYVRHDTKLEGTSAEPVGDEPRRTKKPGRPQ